MKRNFGIKAKLLAMIFLVTGFLSLGGILVSLAFRELLIQQSHQAHSIKILSMLKDLQTAISDGNLNAMDIIVDQSDHSDRKETVGEDRVAEFRKLKDFVEQKRQAYITSAAEISQAPVMTEIFDSLEKVTRASSNLIDTINRGETQSTSFGDFDDIIDTESQRAKSKLNAMRAAFETDFAAGQANLEVQSQKLYETFIVVSSLSVLILFVLGFPTVLSVSSSLKKIRSELYQATLTINRSSENLHAISQKMAASTSESASAIQESVSSMAEMTAMLGQTAQHTMTTSDVAKNAQTQSEKGLEIMQTMADSMSQIGSANQKLQSIVKIINEIKNKTNVINDIVFKTQLLAVNASIEAARAGQHGKGFSVVANEVANLANTSGKAASEIRSLLESSMAQVTEIIDDTSHTVHEGASVSTRAVDAFTSISRSISEISEKVIQITEASREQEAGVRQTTQALSQMNDVTASNSNIARENAALGAHLKQQAERLVRVERAVNFVVAGSERSESKDKKLKRTSRVEQILQNSRATEDTESSQDTKSSREERDDRERVDSSRKKQLAASLLSKAKSRSLVPEGAGNPDAPNTNVDDLEKSDSMREVS